MSVFVGGVQTWDTGLDPREQSVKMSEEVMEVFSAIERCESEDLDPEAWHRSDSMHFRAVDECCDVITATCNLLASIGVTDLRGAMERCAERQREQRSMARCDDIDEPTWCIVSEIELVD